MIDLKKIVADIETYSDKHFNELSHFNNRVIDDALYLLLDEVMNENDIDYVKDDDKYKVSCKRQMFITV